MNHRILLPVVALFVLLASSVRAEQFFSEKGHPFGMGVIIGEPTGFTAQYGMNRHLGLAAGVAYSFEEYLTTYADLEWFFREPWPAEFPIPRLSPYIGAGVGARFSSKDRKAGEHANSGFFRIPLGLEWQATQPRISVFVEIVPVIGFVPKTFGLCHGGIGARYYF